jgi:CRP/FNR family transcriptional regulator
MRQDKLKLLGIKKIFWPVRDVGLKPRGGPASALFGLLPRTSATTEDLADFLKRVLLFEDLEAGHLKRLARLLHERTYRDGEDIFEQGKPGAAMFVLRAGCVDILRRGPMDGDLLLASLEPPASLDESALMAPETVHWFTARARGPVSMLAFGRSDLDALNQNFPVLANKVLAKLAQVTALRLQMLVEELTREQKDSE